MKWGVVLVILAGLGTSSSNVLANTTKKTATKTVDVNSNVAPPQKEAQTQADPDKSDAQVPAEKEPSDPTIHMTRPWSFHISPVGTALGRVNLATYYTMTNFLSLGPKVTFITSPREYEAGLRANFFLYTEKNPGSSSHELNLLLRPMVYYGKFSKNDIIKTGIDSIISSAFRDASSSFRTDVKGFAGELLASVDLRFKSGWIFDFGAGINGYQEKYTKRNNVTGIESEDEPSKFRVHLVIEGNVGFAF